MDYKKMTIEEAKIEIEKLLESELKTSWKYYSPKEKEAAINMFLYGYMYCDEKRIAHESKKK